MHGFALMFLGLALSADPVKISRDVTEIQTRRFALPIRYKADQKSKIERVRLFVSQDRGKSWQHEKDYKPTAEQLKFTAPDDGLYWFALQIVFKDGKSEPAKLEDLEPAMKVYVNSERRTLKVKKSYGELQSEVEELRITVEQLQKKIKELETKRKSK